LNAQKCQRTQTNRKAWTVEMGEEEVEESEELPPEEYDDWE
jgi:hypothetical protein